MKEKVSDLKNLTKDELAVKASALKADLYNLRYQAKTGRIEKPHRINQLKKGIARINSILREQELKDAGAKQA